MDNLIASELVPDEAILTLELVSPVTVIFKSWESLRVLFVYVLDAPYVVITVEPVGAVLTINPPLPVKISTLNHLYYCLLKYYHFHLLYEFE